MMEKAECPVCSAWVQTEHPVSGELLYCTDCACELEVVSLSPLTLQEAPGEGEDWGE